MLRTCIPNHKNKASNQTKSAFPFFRLASLSGYSCFRSAVLTQLRICSQGGRAQAQQWLRHTWPQLMSAQVQSDNPHGPRRLGVGMESVGGLLGRSWTAVMSLSSNMPEPMSSWSLPILATMSCLEHVHECSKHCWNVEPIWNAWLAYSRYYCRLGTLFKG